MSLRVYVCLFMCRDVIVPVFPGTLLLSQWIATKAIPGKTGTNHIPVYVYSCKTRCIDVNILSVVWNIFRIKLQSISNQLFKKLAIIKEDLKRQRAENDSDQDTRNPLLSQSA